MGITRRLLLAGASAAVAAGAVGFGRIAAAQTPIAGEFPIGEPPAIVPMPWLRRDGRLLRADDGRTTILRGVDYAFNTVGLIEESFNLADADLDRIAGWGLNALRIRLRDYRAGWFPSRPAEPGYLEELDRLIARANARGLYVVVACGGPDDLLAFGQHPDDPLFDCAKFLPGNPARAHWLDHLAGIVRRYRDWPGIVGFDLINEDIAFPPGIHDAEFMGPAHAEVLARLRAEDDRHLYFQQPAGWDYQGHSVAVGHDLGGDDRFFSVKWAANLGDPAARLAEMLGWAADAGTDLFVSEVNLFDNPQRDLAALRTLQRQTLALLDRELLGSFRLGYLPAIGASLIDQERREAFWLDELVRPFPVWIGGTPLVLAWDFDARTLRLDLELDGSGETELAVSLDRTYPGGILAETDAGDRLEVTDGADAAAGALRWDGATSRLLLAPDDGRVTLTIAPLDPSRPPTTTTTRTTAVGEGEILLPEPDPDLLAAGGQGFVERLVQSGEFTAEQGRCIVRGLADALEPPQLAAVVGGGALTYTAAEVLGQTVYDCAGGRDG